MASVLVLMAAMVAVILFLLLVAAQTPLTEAQYARAAQSQWLAGACGEYAVAQLEIAIDYPGSQSLTFSEGQCSIGSVGASVSEPFGVETRGISGGSIGRMMWTLLIPELASGSQNTVQVQSRQRVTDF